MKLFKYLSPIFAMGLLLGNIALANRDTNDVLDGIVNADVAQDGEMMEGTDSSNWHHHHHHHHHSYPSCSIVLSPNVVSVGQSVYLYFYSYNASSATINGTPVAVGLCQWLITATTPGTWNYHGVVYGYDGRVEYLLRGLYRNRRPHARSWPRPIAGSSADSATDAALIG